VSVTAVGSRRSELAQFLRSRRARLSPVDVGLAPGLRRRTPGLRREEVAQLAGVGVTWYTWLEQGRPINASVQILDAIARTLRLDEAERAHLYRLAEVPAVPDPAGSDVLPPEIQPILDSMALTPAAIYNGRYDVLAWNAAYAALFPGLASGPVRDRNALWHLFACQPCCSALLDREDELPRMVAQLREAFGRHVGEPDWIQFVRRLSAASAEFAQMWSAHDVASSGPRIKVFQNVVDGGLLHTVTTAFTVVSAPEARMIVYTPVGPEDRALVARAMAAAPRPSGCPAHRPG
jgi:transcriptional regulator with XRE-family HTH domain